MSKVEQIESQIESEQEKLTQLYTELKLAKLDTFVKCPVCEGRSRIKNIPMIHGISCEDNVYTQNYHVTSRYIICPKCKAAISVSNEPSNRPNEIHIQQKYLDVFPVTFEACKGMLGFERNAFETACAKANLWIDRNKESKEK